MQCRVLPTAVAVPDEVRRRLVAEIEAAGLTLEGDGAGPILLVDADALVGREELRLVMYAPGGDRALVARDRGHGVDVAADGVIDPTGLPNARLAGVAVLTDLAAGVDRPESVAAAISPRDRVAAIDARGFDPPRFDASRPVAEQFESLLTPAKAARVRRRAAVKNDDNAWTTLAVSPWSQLVAAGAARVGLSPNAVTVSSMVVAVLAALCFGHGGTGAVLLGAIGVQLAFGLDCADGQLARLTGRFTPTGAWLDWVSDRLKEVVLLVGLAIGTPDGLLLGSAAIAISVTRAQLNQSFEDHRVAQTPTAGGAFGAVPLSRRVKNFITFPYGDRMGMISLVAVAFGTRDVLVVWCWWNAAAALYQLVGRLRRPTGVAAPTLSGLMADGFVARFVRSHAPFVPSALLVVVPVLGVIAVLTADARGWVASIALVVVGAAALVRVASRVWLLPLVTVVAELAAGVSLVAVTSGQAQRVALIMVAVAGCRRLVAATGARHAATATRGLGWDGRVLAGLALAAAEPMLVLVLVVVTSAEVVATLWSQFMTVSRRSGESTSAR